MTEQQETVFAYAMPKEVPEHLRTASAWTRGWMEKSPLRLNRVADLNGVVQFRAVEADGSPMPASALDENPNYEIAKYLRNGWLVFEGDPTPWELVREEADANASDQLVVYLRHVELAAPR